MYAADTIVAIATPPGRGGIGIVRLSGPAACGIAAQVFRPRRLRGRPASHRMYAGEVVEGSGEPIDEALAVYMYAPHSYTGEDVVELHCHGSPVVLRRVVRRCCAAGARVAEPGEFTKRAFLNGRIDLVQAEAVAEIVHARTEAAARTGLRHLSGQLSAELAALREALVAAKAHAEAWIDFAEDEVEVTPEALEAELRAIAARIDALLASYERGRLVREGLHLAIVGKPNVGKSSLLNALAGADRAIVTEVPGTTRDVIEESVEIGGVEVVLSDTAGLREEAGHVERLGIERARRRAAEADGVLVVLDRSQPLAEEDWAVIAAMEGQPGLIVANKCDLPPRWEPRCALAGLPKKAVEVSARTGAGLVELQQAVVELFQLAEVDPELPLLTLVRHREALAQARDSLGLAIEGLTLNQPIDLVAVDLQSAVEHIGSITGAVVVDEVLDRIFREFCIGK